MIYESVKSSTLSSVGYAEATSTLSVVFLTKKAYFYQGVPKSKHEGLLKSESKGKYFSTEIRDQYTCFELEGMELVPKDTLKKLNSIVLEAP